MIDKVRSTLLQHDLAAEREPLWVAVSGGCDSMVLLHVLRELRHPVHVVHVDHGLRGAKSAADAAFVETHCRELGVPFVVERVDVEALVRSSGLSKQMAARELRYAVFHQCVEKGPQRLAMAHHADDAVETLFIHLLQGMGTRGWGAIPLQSGPFIRPLLEVSRSAIRAYAREKEIPFREDASNADPAYLRNRVRHELMPLIGELRDGADAVLRRDMVRNRELAAVLAQWLDTTASRWQPDAQGTLRIPAEAVLNSAAPSLLLTHLLRDLDLHPDRIGEVLKALRADHTGAQFPAGGMMVQVDRGHLVMARGDSNHDHWVIHTWDALPAGLPISVEVLPPDVDAGPLSPDVLVAERDTLPLPLVLRPWRTGDRFRPAGMVGTKLVSDLLIDAKVPLHQKAGVHVLESRGTILWVCGQRVADGLPMDRSRPRVRLVWNGFH
ncbi:MAG TPA: tRNA lysidine(34) synthetase TilS [Flavobacteriales bacterium]|nr:tRNA lysidine(34) synthetase TilS [Flavobacteriales bacterium]